MRLAALAGPAFFAGALAALACFVGLAAPLACFFVGARGGVTLGAAEGVLAVDFPAFDLAAAFPLLAVAFFAVVVLAVFFWAVVFLGRLLGPPSSWAAVFLAVLTCATRLARLGSAFPGGELDASEVLAALSGELRPEMLEAVRRCHERLATGLLTNNFSSSGWRQGLG